MLFPSNSMLLFLSSQRGGGGVSRCHRPAFVEHLPEWATFGLFHAAQNGMTLLHFSVRDSQVPRSHEPFASHLWPETPAPPKTKGWSDQIMRPFWAVDPVAPAPVAGFKDSLEGPLEACCCGGGALGSHGGRHDQGHSTPHPLQGLA